MQNSFSELPDSYCEM